MNATPGTSAIRNNRIHRKFVKYGFFLFFVSLVDSFLMIASRQTIVFIVHNALMIAVIGFCGLIRLTDLATLYAPFLILLAIALVAQVLFIALIVFTCALLCSNHDGCVNATIYYVINIVTRLLIAATLYKLTEYAWLAYKQDQAAQKLAADQHRVAVDTQLALNTAYASAATKKAARLSN